MESVVLNKMITSQIAAADEAAKEKYNLLTPENKQAIISLVERLKAGQS